MGWPGCQGPVDQHSQEKWTIGEETFVDLVSGPVTLNRLRSLVLPACFEVGLRARVLAAQDDLGKKEANDAYGWLGVFFVSRSTY